MRKEAQGAPLKVCCSLLIVPCRARPSGCGETFRFRTSFRPRSLTCPYVCVCARENVCCRFFVLDCGASGGSSRDGFPGPGQRGGHVAAQARRARELDHLRNPASERQHPSGTLFSLFPSLASSLPLPLVFIQGPVPFGCPGERNTRGIIIVSTYSFLCAYASAYASQLGERIRTLKTFLSAWMHRLGFRFFGAALGTRRRRPSTRTSCSTSATSRPPRCSMRRSTTTRTR